MELALKLPHWSPDKGAVTINTPGIFDTRFGTLGDIVSALLPYLILFAGLGFFAAMIYSGFNFMTSGGDPKKIESAKGCLMNSLVGFIVVLTSYFLIRILNYIFGLGMFE